MRKILFIILLIVVIIALLFFITSNLNPEKPQNLTGDLATLKSLNPLNSDIRTIAICNETNFCQDYKITCSNGQVIEKMPIKDAVVQHSEDWKDTRNIDYENLCT